METMEKLLLQIFDKKRWIVEQVMHQRDVYDQYLASKCLIEGIPPPPWLCSPSLPFQSSAELKKEEIISGLLLPPSRPSIICFNSRGFTYQQPVITADYVKIQDTSPAGEYPMNKGSREEDWQPNFSNNLDIIGSVSNALCGHDPNVTSPGHSQDKNIPKRASSAGFEHDPNVPFQGYSQDERMPKNASSVACEQDLSVRSPGYCQGERVLESTSATCCEMDPNITSPGNYQDEIAQEGYPGPAVSLARVQRSKSRQRALELRNSAKASKSRSNCKGDFGASASEYASSQIASLRSDHVNEIKFSMSDVKNEEGCRAEEANTDHLLSKERDQDVYFSTIARSRSPGQKPISVREPSNPDESASFALQSGSSIALLQTGYVNEVGFSKPVRTVDEGYAAEEARMGDLQHKKGSETVYSGKLTSSKFPAQASTSQGERSNCIKFSSAEQWSRNSNDSPRSGHEKELSQPITADDVDIVAEEARACDLQPQKGNETAYFGRITRSRSSAKESSSKAKCSNYGKSSSVEPQSRSSNASFRCGHEKDFSQPITGNGERAVAEETRFCYLQSQEGNETAYFGRISRSRSSAKESSSKSKCSNYGKSSSVKLRSRGSDASFKSGREKELSQPLTANDEDFVAEEATACDSQPRKGNETVCSDKTTRTAYAAQEISTMSVRSNRCKSSSIELQSGSSNATLKSDDEIEMSKAITTNDAGFIAEEEKTGDIQRKEKEELVYSGGISRSRRLGQAAISMNQPINVGKPTVQENWGLPKDSVALSSEMVEPSVERDDSCKVGPGDLLSSPMHDLSMFVKSVQLEFHGNEEYNLDETSALSLANEKHGKSPKKKLMSDKEMTVSVEHGVLDKEEKPTKSSSVNHAPLRLSLAKEPDWSSSIDWQKELKLCEEMTILEEHGVLNKDKKPNRSPSLEHADLIMGASRLPDSDTASSVKETSEVHIDLVTDNLRKSKNSSLANPLSHESTKLEFPCKHSSDNMPMEAFISHISNLCAEKERKLSVKEDLSQLDVLKHSKSASTASNQGNVINVDDSMPIRADFPVVEPVTFNHTYICLTDSAPEHSSATLAKGLEEDSVQRRRKSCHSQHKVKKSSEQRCIPNDRSLASSRPGENDVLERSMQALGSSSPALMGSWLKNKRRKTQGQRSNSMPVSASSRHDALDSNYGNWEAGLVHHSRENRSLEPYDVELQKMIGSGFSSELQLAEGSSFDETGGKGSASVVFIAKQHSIDGGQVFPYDEDGPQITQFRTCIKETSHLLDDGKVAHDLVDSPHQHSMGLTCYDQRLPVLERFIIQADVENPRGSIEQINVERWELPKTTVERASILEQICRSSCMDTPSLHLPTAYNLHEKPNLHQVDPNGLLEDMVPGSSLHMTDDDSKKLEDGSLFAKFPVEHAVHGRFHSDYLPFSGAESSVDVRNPYSSPLGKLWCTGMSKSASSEKRGSSSPYLPCIDEENENMEEAAETFREDGFLELKKSSVERKPLAYLTEDTEPPVSLNEAEIHVDRQSLESVNTEFSFTATCNSVKGEPGKQNGAKRRCTGKGKENRSVLRGATVAKRNTGPLHYRPSKPKLSENASLRNQGPSLSEKEPKRNNIVSNITSFIPLVQPKQLPAAITGKRDVKVKALEAAEAAKRLAEKKENERKMKKEALKLERARQEQENLKKHELEKKKKEEERKKKEAEMAERKRQREEEEKKLKGAKRKRVGEAQRQQREPVAKLLANKEEKELRIGATDVKAQGQKESKVEIDSVVKIGQGQMSDNPCKVPEVGSKTTRSSNGNDKNMIVSGDNFKVTSNSSEAKEEAILSTGTIEESYDISPFRDSDDECEENDEIPNTKFIPAWASKNCILLAISSQQSIDPEKIFPPKSFCSTSEVLVPQKLQMR